MQVRMIRQRHHHLIIFVFSLVALSLLSRYFSPLWDTHISSNRNIDILRKSTGQLYLMSLSSSYSKNHTFIRTAVSNITTIFRNRKAIIIYDIGPCFWVAQGALVHGRTGGEYVWCQSLIGQLIEIGKEVYVTNSSRIAKELASTCHLHGNNVITISHWGWQEIAHWKMFAFRSEDRIPVPSIGAECLIKMNFWGTDVATEVWPGSLKRYLTVYPTVGGQFLELRDSIGSREVKNHEEGKEIPDEQKNTASGFGDQFLKCGDDEVSRAIANDFKYGSADKYSAQDLAILNTILQNSAGGYDGGHSSVNSSNLLLNSTRFIPNNPYYVIFGKFGIVVPSKKIPPLLRNSSVWAFLGGKELNGIVLHCEESLFPTLQADPSQFTCLEPNSVFKRAPYYHLLLSKAAFVLGLGVPVLSTTPFEALTCNTSVIMPRGQHTFLEQFADSSSQFYGVGSAEGFEAAVDEILLIRSASKHTDAVFAPRAVAGSSRVGVGRIVGQLFEQGKKDLRALLDDVEGSCLGSMRH